MTNPSQPSGFRTFVVVVSAIFGLFLLIGGIWLAAIGGSWYYIFAGILFLATAILLQRYKSSALLVYAFLVLASVIWGLWEVGSDFYALAPRLDILGVWGLVLLIPAVTRGFVKSSGAKLALTGSLALTILVMIYSLFNDPQEVRGTLTTAQPATVEPTLGVADDDWPAYGRTQEGVRYSPLNQINDKNVKNLKVAWTYHTGEVKTDNDSGETTNQVTPIKVGNNMYICTTHQRLISLDPATGKEKWVYDPKLKADNTYQHLTCRGVSYFDASNTAGFAASLQNKKSSSTECPRKIILPVNDGRLVAVNADTGKACSDFGHDGQVDLQKDMPYPYPGGYIPTSPPVVTGTTIIIGGSTTDNFSNKEPSGVIRGYDVNTGALLWVFDTGAENPNAIPAPGQTFVNNSPNAWAPLAYDAKLDIVYVPTGVGTPDIWGGDRSALKERYANSMLALNASTGKLVWNFQTTHHDLWDMDVPSQPSLADINVNGQKVPAIYVLTKTGNAFVLDRRDGKAIVPITEKPVPQTVKLGPQTKGEHYSATQPFSDFDLAPKEKLTDKQMWGATMFDQMMCRISFKRLNYDGIYTPPSENGTLVFPGNLGVFEWGGMSVNPDRQIAVMNPIGLPFVSKLIPADPNRPHTAKGAGTEQGVQPMYGAPYGVEINAFLSPLGLPCKQPAWGYVAGVDLKTHQVAWKRRIGTVRDSLPGIPLPPFKMGVPMLGGSISTAGNLMFVGATQDDYIRAINVTNGDELWKGRLPAGGQATPMTYAINGKQYVVIMAGGHGSFGTKMGDSLVAYALD
ncbi:glucose/quinate/shikimate family membrane-bound PQQ-dependent dehydrogenase [Acinetobacter gerneri]|jgi:quinoprotein glucose dehydrogenase|uniref:glucose/quinate/shikimate family membrane-bound PQQ-dependent dehydrogenase n=1 Tax=Acinetobacter gerneri TaxID=202952 RepID=UPI0023F2BD0F|nr:glucose/quinate/shikimate family membrane-bound PQQ-dependent dehydrogenase [Acinetobacter gerneri]MCH4244491.1 glucose/quinate/shikimate family membrane-bound PQQ-dependent dehydrogenase [Acinetobacter gerneri]